MRRRSRVVEGMPAPAWSSAAARAATAAPMTRRPSCPARTAGGVECERFPRSGPADHDLDTGAGGDQLLNHAPLLVRQGGPGAHCRGGAGGDGETGPLLSAGPGQQVRFDGEKLGGGEAPVAEAGRFRQDNRALVGHDPVGQLGGGGDGEAIGVGGGDGFQDPATVEGAGVGGEAGGAE